jgi:hypothetical protein
MSSERFTGEDIATILSAAFAAKVKRIRVGELYVEFENYVELPSFSGVSSDIVPPELEQMRAELQEMAEMDDLLASDPDEYEKRLIEKENAAHKKGSPSSVPLRSGAKT